MDYITAAAQGLAIFAGLYVFHRLAFRRGFKRGRLDCPSQAITLTQEDFRELVMGRAVYKDGVAIILNDIGFHVMEQEISDARKALFG